MAIQYALSHGRKSVTLVHKGNIMKFTEGAFRDWGYEVAKEEFRREVLLESEFGEKEMHPYSSRQDRHQRQNCRCYVSANPLEA